MNGHLHPVSLSVLEDCVKNHHPYYTKLVGNTKILLIEKYMFLNSFEILVLPKDHDIILHHHQDLSPFDTCDMIKELLSSINDK